MKNLMIISGVLGFLGLLAGVILRIVEAGFSRTVLLVDLAVWVFFMFIAFAYFYKRLRKKSER